MAVGLALGAAEAPVVLGDGFFEPRRDLRRRLSSHCRALGGVAVLGELELELLREIHELLELLLDELGIPRDAAAQRVTELADRAQLLVGQPLSAQLVAERQQLARRIIQLLLHVVDGARVVPEAAIARIPNAAAPPVVEVADTAGAKAAVAIADLAALVAAGVRLRTALTLLLALALLALLPLLGLPALADLDRSEPGLAAA